jgi:hypothetical protein
MSLRRQDGFSGDPVKFHRRPRLRRPVILASFEGWNDAGEAASQATGFVAESWGAVRFAEIDPEEFFDFTEVRPEIQIAAGVSSTISWPATQISAARPPDLPFDVVLLRGHEPQLRWRTYCEAVVRLATQLHAELVVSYGAYLAEVVHSRPVPITATSADQRLLDLHHLARTVYEGPTGIIGVLDVALADAGVPAVSLWASVPYYTSAVAASATLALVQRTELLLGCSFDTEALERDAVLYERQMDDLVAEDEHVAAYVAHIEEEELDETTSATSIPLGSPQWQESIAEEAEHYLRQHHRG